MDAWLNARRVTEIECLVPDLTGVARGKILPRAKFAEERGMRIPEAVLGMTVTGNYPQDDAAYLRAISATDRDMILKADPATIAMVPWAADPDRASAARLLFRRWWPGRFRPAQRLAARAAPVRRARLGAHGAARSRVLPDRAQCRSRPAAALARGPQRAR
ncbi:glutamine synthetase [Massilia sp. B-10]|nr:glutamine synthetase [Massilia sp. B-10]